MKIVLLNDTYSWYHWGCTGTSEGIRNELTAKGYELTFIPITDVYQFSNTPSRIEDFDSLAFFETAQKTNRNIYKKIEDADILIMNGEGTIHHLNAATIALLYIAYSSKKYLNKTVQIINHSAYPLYHDKQYKILTENIYSTVYKTLDYVGIREHLSRQCMTNIGVKSNLTFDCLPLSLEQKGLILPKTEKQNYIVLANSVSFPQDRIPDLVKTIKKLTKDNLQVKILTGAKANPAPDETKFMGWMQPYINELGWQEINATSLIEWYQCIANSRLIISGRFHHSIAAFFQNTPLILMASNTPKNRALTETFNIYPPIDYTDKAYNKKLLRLGQLLLNKPTPSDPEIINSLLERAKLNFLNV